MTTTPKSEAAMDDDMEPRSKNGYIPRDDPSALAIDAIERATAAQRDYVDGQIAVVNERLRGIDIATELLSATVTRVPTDLTKTQNEILQLMNERDRGVQARFDANEKLSKTESELNQTALAAALQAAKEAAAVSATALETRITSQGFTTDRTIEKNAELSAQAIGSMDARVTAQSEQLIRVERQLAEQIAGKQAIGEQKHDTRGGAANIYGLVGMIVGVLALVLSTVIIIATR